MANYNLKEKVTLNGRTFFVMRVKAENIELRNFGYHGSTDLKTLTEAGVIGMNGCFFGINIYNGRSTLNNIVYQGGQPLGSLIDDSDVAKKPFCYLCPPSFTEQDASSVTSFYFYYHIVSQPLQAVFS